jgi:hypothetical protein
MVKPPPALLFLAILLGLKHVGVGGWAKLAKPVMMNSATLSQWRGRD